MGFDGSHNNLSFIRKNQFVYFINNWSKKQTLKVDKMAMLYLYGLLLTSILIYLSLHLFLQIRTKIICFNIYIIFPFSRAIIFVFYFENVVRIPISLWASVKSLWIRGYVVTNPATVNHTKCKQLQLHAYTFHYDRITRNVVLHGVTTRRLL